MPDRLYSAKQVRELFFANSVSIWWVKKYVPGKMRYGPRLLRWSESAVRAYTEGALQTEERPAPKPQEQARAGAQEARTRSALRRLAERGDA